MPPADRQRPDQLRVLVGIPDPDERARITGLLRCEGHWVVEAADARQMAIQLDERDRASFDAIVCAGLLSEQDDPALTARLTNLASTRALILLPAGGLLSTATRAQRMQATAVLPDAPSLRRLRELVVGESIPPASRPVGA